MLKFSVIVPVYNVENYLKRCVDSLLAQNYKDYEIILVDDGSPDKCPKICDEYAKKNEKIIVIHKKNGGLSSARNEGIKIAKGDYLIFVDSDDFWRGENALKEISENLNKSRADVLFFNNIDFSCVTKKERKLNKPINCDLIKNNNKNTVLKYLFNERQFPGAAWVTVTKTDFIKTQKIYFTEGIKAEDVDWLLNVFLNAKSFDAIDSYFYIYLKYRDGSITGTANLKSIEDIIYIIDKWTNIILEKKYDFIRDSVYGYLSHHYICAILIINNLVDVNKNSAIEKLNKYKYLLKYNNSIVGKIINKFVNVFGLKTTSYMLGFIKKYRRF